jgi:hypothetical protein
LMIAVISFMALGAGNASSMPRIGAIKTVPASRSRARSALRWCGFSARLLQGGASL